MKNSYILSKEIYIFRHGETDWNKQHRAHGCENDIELNNIGRKQAVIVGDYLHNNEIKADLIISSGMSRADETARIISNKIEYHLPILIIDNLKEKCHGKISGLNKDDIKSNPEFDKYRELSNKFTQEKDPIKQREIFYSNNIIFNDLYGDELYSDFRHRIKKALKEIYSKKEKIIIIVSHSGTIQQLLQIITNTTDYIKGEFSNGSNCHMSYIQIFEKISNNKIKRKIKIIKLLTTAHLHIET
jgi:broad specificity phosphatase PhoE